MQIAGGHERITLREKNERASEQISSVEICLSEHGVFPDVPRRSRSERSLAERGRSARSVPQPFA